MIPREAEMKKLRIALVTVLSLAAFVSAVPKARAAACPIPEFCMRFEDGTCTCEGYTCNGRYYCAIPHVLG
jgi:hypothetical protein